jgi:hypothetical protein
MNEALEQIKKHPAPECNKDSVKQAVAAWIESNDFRWAGDSPESAAEDIADVFRRGMDGYEIARDLEKYQDWFDLDLQIAEELDGVDSVVREWMHKARSDWVKAWNIQPPFPIGTVITRGVIDGISEHTPAQYLVKTSGDQVARWGGLLLLNFEDAHLAEKST